LYIRNNEKLQGRIARICALG